MNLGKILRESLTIKEGSDRSNYISELRDLGCNYNFDKYSDQQLYCIWKKAKAKAEKEQAELRAEGPKEIRVCPNCGGPLNDGGTCPKCDDGEEDESLKEDSSNLSGYLSFLWDGKLPGHNEDKGKVGLIAIRDFLRVNKGSHLSYRENRLPSGTIQFEIRYDPSF